MDEKNRIEKKLSQESGFSLQELLIVAVILSVLSGFALIKLSSARASMRVQNSVRQLASYMEKARVDAVRRHGQASVEFTTPTSYTATLDFNNNGVPVPRSYTFEQGVALATSELPTVTFNWRGRTQTETGGSSCVTTFSVTNGTDGLSVDVSGSGDVTIENQQPSVPNVSYNVVDPSLGIRQATVVGGTETVESTPCDVPTDSVGGEGGSPSCLMHWSSSSITIKKNGGSASVLLSMSSPSRIDASFPSNLTVTPGFQTVSTGSSFTITSNNTLRGPFDVTFSAACGYSTIIRVNVTN